jgi:hypothetical protein
MAGTNVIPIEPRQPSVRAELAAMERIVRLMERSDAGTRRRIMHYLNSRYPSPSFMSRG